MTRQHLSTASPRFSASAWPPPSCWPLPRWQRPSQPSSVTFGRALNAMSSPEALTTDGPRTTGASVEAEHKLADERLRLYYTLDAGDYNTPGDWTFFENSVGDDLAGPAAGTSGPSVFAGVVGTVADRTAVRGRRPTTAGSALFLNAEWKPAETKTFRAGYRFDARAFPGHGGPGPGRTRWLRQRVAEPQVADHADRRGARRARSGTTSSTPTMVTTTIAVPPAGSGGLKVRGARPRLARAGDRGDHARAGTRRAARSAGPPGSSPCWGASRSRWPIGPASRSSTCSGRPFGALPTAVVTTPALFFDDGVYDDPFASDADDAAGVDQAAAANGMAIEAAASGPARITGAPPRSTPTATRPPAIRCAPTGSGRRGASWTMPVVRERTGPWDFGVTSTTCSPITGRTTRSTTTRRTPFGFGFSWRTDRSEQGIMESTASRASTGGPSSPSTSSSRFCRRGHLGLVLFISPPGRIANWSQWRFAALLESPGGRPIHTVFASSSSSPPRSTSTSTGGSS